MDHRPSVDAMYWSNDGTTLRVTADYENPREISRTKLLRSDGRTFCGLSRELVIDQGSRSARTPTAFCALFPLGRASLGVCCTVCGTGD